MLRRIDHKELPVLGDILIAVGAVVMILREQVLHIGKRQCATHQNRDAVLRNYIAPAVAVRIVELRDLLVIGFPIVSGVHEDGNAKIRRRENKKVAVVKKHGRAGIIVRVDRLTVLTVKLKAEALV